MNKPTHIALIITSFALTVLSGYALGCLGTGNIFNFVLLAIVCVDTIFFPWAFCYHIDLRTKGETSFLDRFPFHSGYVLFFFISPYFAFLYIKKCIKK